MNPAVLAGCTATIAGMHDPVTEGVKTCKRCRAEKPVADFPIERTCLGGRKHVCKACVSAAERLRWEQAQLAANPAYVKRPPADNSSEARRARGREEARQRRLKNPERERMYNRRSFVKWRVGKAGGVWIEDVEALVVLEMDDGLCGICGEDVDPFRFDLDHIVPLSKGGEHSYANVQVAHSACNIRKRDSLPESVAA